MRFEANHKEGYLRGLAEPANSKHGLLFLSGADEFLRPAGHRL
jgi:hypothetical protein